MLLTELMDHDLHRSRGGEPVPLVLHVPVPKDCFPAVVSGTRGQFLVSTGLSKETGLAAVGVFPCDSDKLDSVLGPLLKAAHGLSKGSFYTRLVRKSRRVNGKPTSVPTEVKVSGTYENSFVGPGAAQEALSYIRKNSGLKAQPHACLVPDSWDGKRIKSFFGKEYDPKERKFAACCRVISHDVPMPVFFSRPDMVGMYTQFMNGGAAIILHNVELGLAFCP
jgi:hypothetical protein